MSLITILFFGIVLILIFHFLIKQFLIGKKKQIIRNLKVPPKKKKKVTIIEPKIEKLQLKQNLKNYLENLEKTDNPKDIELDDMDKFFQIQNNDLYLIPKTNLKTINSSSIDTIEPFQCDDMMYSSFSRY